MTLSAGAITALVGGTLLLHGIALVVALGALVLRAMGTASSSSGPVIQSWLVPSLPPRAAAAVAIPFWALSGVGFVLAAMSFWAVAIPPGPWRQLAVGAAIVSLGGIALFSGVWPGASSTGRSVLDTSIAVVVDIAVLVVLLGLHWPPPSSVGR